MSTFRFAGFLLCVSLVCAAFAQAQPAPGAAPSPPAPTAASAPSEQPAAVPALAAAPAPSAQPATTPAPAAAPSPSEQPAAIPTPVVIAVKPRKMCARDCPMAVDPRGEPPLHNKATIALDVGVSQSKKLDESAWWLSPVFSGWYPVGEMLALSVKWGFSSVVGGPNPGEAKRIGVGNPLLAIHSVRRHGCSELRLGVGVTLPYASNVFVLLPGAQGASGVWEPWLWTIGAPSIVVPIAWETILSDTWFWGGELSPAMAASGEYGEFSVQYIWIPIALQAGFRAGVFSAGLRLQDVWMPVHDYNGHDESQFSVVPFVRAQLGRGFLSARFTMNIDEPYGPSFKSDTFWGLNIGAGVEF